MQNALVPKWKERTEQTHMEHLTLLREKPALAEGPLFLGDSMFERWKTTGKQWWAKDLVKHNIMNAGVGGDKIENLLWRITPPNGQRGILDSCKYKKIFLMIGTNNLTEKRATAESIANSIDALIDIIQKKQPNVPIVFFALPPRSDVGLEKITGVNKLLKDICTRRNLTFVDFTHGLSGPSYFDDPVHLSTLGYRVWFTELEKHLN